MVVARERCRCGASKLPVPHTGSWVRDATSLPSPPPKILRYAYALTPDCESIENANYMYNQDKHRQCAEKRLNYDDMVRMMYKKS
jgi:hypothetical protein